MGNITRFIRQVHSRYPWVLHWVLPLTFFLLCALYYQGTIARCGDYLMAGPGDQTAGLIWMHQAVPAKPLWGFTNLSNYPWGENLHNPIQWSGALLYFWYWLLSSLVGGVCGYNLMNIIGFFASATVMYAFVKWLTKQPAIALLAGYAVSFTPYYQAKTSGHPSYVYQGMFVLLIWLFVKFWRRPTWRIAAALSAVLAATFYIDPYFVLLSSVVMVGLFGTAIGYDIYRHQTANWKQKMLMVGVMAIVGAVLLLPLAYVRVHYAGQINQTVANSRGAIKAEAEMYGARPLEYLVPTESHPILKALIPGYGQNRNHHGSNPGEYVINLSLTLIALVLVAGIVLIIRRRRTGQWWPTRHGFQIDPGFFAVAIAVVGALAFIFSLPPLAHGIKTPTYYLTSLITMWRVFARLYVIVNISLVLLSALALLSLWALIHSPKWRTALLLLLLAGTAFEYQAYKVPRPVWSYRENTPPIYYRLAQRTGIKTIAEYSLDEEPQTGLPAYERTYEMIDHKRMLNSALADSPEATMRGSLRDLEDPQTIPVLRSLGISAIVVHGAQVPLNLSGLELIDSEQDPPPTASLTFGPYNHFFPIAIYRLADGPRADFETTLESGFVYPEVDGPVSFDYVGGTGAVMDLRALPGHAPAGQGEMCFNLKAARLPVDVMLTADNHEIWHGHLGDDWQSVRLPLNVGEKVTMLVSRPGSQTVKFDDLGCPVQPPSSLPAQ